MSDRATPSKREKLRHAPKAALWFIPLAIIAIWEATGLADRDGHGPLSRAYWVVTDPGPASAWWGLGAALLWLVLHLQFPGVRTFEWVGLLWMVALALAAWGTGRLLGLF